MIFIDIRNRRDVIYHIPSLRSVHCVSFVTICFPWECGRDESHHYGGALPSFSSLLIIPVHYHGSYRPSMVSIFANSAMNCA